MCTITPFSYSGDASEFEYVKIGGEKLRFSHFFYSSNLNNDVFDVKQGRLRVFSFYVNMMGIKDDKKTLEDYVSHDFDEI